MTSHYLIQGTYGTMKYFLRIKPVVRWEGLQDNATQFDSRPRAQVWISENGHKCKLKLEIIPVDTKQL